MRMHVAALVWMVVFPCCCTASVTYYTGLEAFQGATASVVVEDFESVEPKDVRVTSFVSHGNTYTGQGGEPTPNVVVASPGYTNFGIPVTTSSILTASGNDDFTVTFGAPSTAVGFDTYVNAFGPITIRLFGATGLLDTHSLSHDATKVGFFGAVASEPITSVRWTGQNGSVVNTGIDTIRQGSPTLSAPLRIAGGLATASPADVSAYNVEPAGPNTTAITLLDAVKLLRAAHGL